MTPMPTEEWQPTEWFDDGEPAMGIRLDPEDLGTPWSALHVGMRVRFKTQTFVKRGTITSVKKWSMLVRFDGHISDTAIPDAKWYYCQARMGNLNEHLVSIATPPVSTPTGKLPSGYKAGMSSMSPNEAAARLGTDPKNIRRMIRSGKLPATRQGGRWVVDRSDVEALA